MSAGARIKMRPLSLTQLTQLTFCGIIKKYLYIADFRNSFASRSEDSVRENSFQFRAVAAQSSAGVVAARDEAPESVLGACAGYPSIFPIIPPSAGPVRRFLHTATA